MIHKKRSFSFTVGLFYANLVTCSAGLQLEILEILFKIILSFGFIIVFFNIADLRKTQVSLKIYPHPPQEMSHIDRWGYIPSDT